MRGSLTASLLLVVGLLTPSCVSPSSPEDSEGSGYDLMNGSGSGDGTEEDSTGDIMSTNGRSLAENVGGGHETTFHASSDLSNHIWAAGENEPDFVILASSKSLLENEEIRAGVIAGGVTGVLFAAMITAVLIYKWQKKDEAGYILGRRRDSDE